MTRPETPPASSIESDWLDELLAQDGARHRRRHLHDAGFANRVMASLPAPAAVAIPSWRRPAVALLWGASAVGVAMALPGATLDVVRDAMRFFAGYSPSIGDVLAVLALLTAATWTATAYAVAND